MARKKCILQIDVSYDDKKTDPESLASAFDTLLTTAMSTPGVLDDYGKVNADEFFVLGFAASSWGVEDLMSKADLTEAQAYELLVQYGDELRGLVTQTANQDILPTWLEAHGFKLKDEEDEE